MAEISGKAHARLGALRDAGIDPGIEERELQRRACMGVTVRLHWLIALQSQQLGYGDQPLGYVFGPRFAASVVEHHETSREQLAWVCAALVCGQQPASLEVHRLTDCGQELSRADGATAFTARLSHSAPSQGSTPCNDILDRPDGLRLHFWWGRSTVEFVSIAST